jgi:hypothetical protein
MNPAAFAATRRPPVENVTCRNRQDAIALFRRCNSFLNGLFGFKPTYIAIEGNLLLDYLRFLGARNDEVPWGTLVEGIVAFLAKNPGDFLVQFAHLLEHQVHSNKEWKKIFNDDELFGPLHWFDFRYTPVRADAQCIVLKVRWNSMEP